MDGSIHRARWRFLLTPVVLLCSACSESSSDYRQPTATTPTVPFTLTATIAITPTSTTTPTPTASGTATASSTITATMTAAPTVATVLLDELRSQLLPLCSGSTPLSSEQVEQTANGVTYACESRGHRINAWLTRYDTQSDAETAFASTTYPGCYASFAYRDLPAARCCTRALSQEPCSPGQDRDERWVIRNRCWILSIHAFDDTHFRVGPEPQTVADVFTDTGNTLGLPAECDCRFGIRGRRYDPAWQCLGTREVLECYADEYKACGTLYVTAKDPAGRCYLFPSTCTPTRFVPAQDGDCPDLLGFSNCYGHRCQDDSECAHGFCVDGVCCRERCPQTAVCNVSGFEGTCMELTSGHQLGLPCAADHQCQSNHCSDGVCCLASECPKETSCSVPGSEGRCAPLTASR